ncbi:MAG TPA: hypothetical protein VM286_00765 [Candidatus Thermoplasmatota archaeon]|nr:hypothetical protein [Candidatus Thermoplasmatota archaeon]
MVGVLKTTGITTANIGFLDNDPLDGSVSTTEAIVLSFFGDNLVHNNDIVLSPGNGLTAAAGSAVTNAPTGALDYTVTAGALTSLLRFVDSLPTYAQGGPDGKLNPGEPLFLDLDNSFSPTNNDRLLAAGAGVSGSAGGAVSGTQTDSVWDKTTECIYSSTDTTSSAGDTLVTVDLPVCPALGAPMVAISGIKFTSITRSVADAVTSASSTTITSATAAFVAGDIGFSVTGGSIPANTRIASVTNPTTAVLTNAATAAGTGIALVIGDAATFDPGEEAYVTGGSTVTTGDFRLTTTSGGAAGTLAACNVFGTDADCGVALAATAATNTYVTLGSKAFTLPATPFGFFDVNGNALYDGTDQVLLDADSNDFVTPGDVRLTTAGSQGFGSRPILGNPEVHAVLMPTALTAAIMYLESGTNPTQIDVAEPLAIHFGAGLTLALNDLCLTAVGGCAAGTQRLGTATVPATGGTWTLASGAANPGTLGYLDANNNNNYDVGDSLYLHFGAVPGNVASGDLLLASDAGANAQRASASTGALKAFTATYRAFDADGSTTYSAGDLVYIDLGTANVAEPGDVRLNTGTGVSSFGKNLLEADADTVNVLTDASASATPFSYRDLDNNIGFTLGDPVFLMPRATTCPLVGSDVVLAPATLASATAGSFAGALTTTTCTDIPAGPKFAFTPAGAYSTASVLYVDLDGDGTLETGDVRITSSAAGASGTRIGGAATTDVNSPATVITLGTPKISYADASGDAVAAGGETVVLDKDGDGFFTPGDVPLSGSAVASGGGGGGGGGGGNPVVTSTVTSTPTSTSTSTSTASSTSSTTVAVDLATINKALQASMTVTRDGENNIVKWTLQPGVLGYQVWSHNSPWALVLTVGADTNTIVQKAPADTHYLVTAYTSEATKLTDINTQAVPGLGVDPDGAGAGTTSGGKGAIPAPGVLVGLGAVAVALVLARRRLA